MNVQNSRKISQTHNFIHEDAISSFYMYISHKMQWKCMLWSFLMFMLFCISSYISFAIEIQDVCLKSVLICHFIVIEIFALQGINNMTQTYKSTKRICVSYIQAQFEFLCGIKSFFVIDKITKKSVVSKFISAVVLRSLLFPYLQIKT